MTNHHEIDKIHTLPQFAALSPCWKNYFLENDKAIQENFWGNLATFKNAEHDNDAYIQQQKEMGYCFEKGLEAPAPFYQAMAWVFGKLHHFLDQGILTLADILWPARVFEVNRRDSTGDYIFCVIGQDPPESAREVELVLPHIYSKMIALGYYPMGSAIREHTNQTLAEHDLAHYGGFVSSPNYMRVIREAFRRICQKMKENPKVKEALEDFNSAYSLRLYYMTEIFTVIPDHQKKRLHHLLEINLEEPVNLKEIIQLLEKKATHPANLYQYLYRIYEQFHELVNPIGGESRDILNRVRKFNRMSRLGTYFGDKSYFGSKFDGSSIYSLYLNGCAALENKRSTHPDFINAIREIHAPFIGTLIGTSQLTVEDWVLQAVEESPDPHSKLYKYLCKSRMWNESHLIYWAHWCPDYTRILPRKQSYPQQSMRHEVNDEI